MTRFPRFCTKSPHEPERSPEVVPTSDQKEAKSLLGFEVGDRVCWIEATGAIYEVIKISSGHATIECIEYRGKSAPPLKRRVPLWQIKTLDVGSDVGQQNAKSSRGLQVGSSEQIELPLDATDCSHEDLCLPTSTCSAESSQAQGSLDRSPCDQSKHGRLDKVSKSSQELCCSQNAKRHLSCALAYVQCPIPDFPHKIDKLLADLDSAFAASLNSQPNHVFEVSFDDTPEPFQGSYRKTVSGTLLHSFWNTRQNSAVYCFLLFLEEKTVPRTDGKTVHVQSLAHLNHALAVCLSSKLSSTYEMPELPQTDDHTQRNIFISLTYSLTNKSRWLNNHFFTWIFFPGLADSHWQQSLLGEYRQLSLSKSIQTPKLSCNRTGQTCQSTQTCVCIPLELENSTSTQSDSPAQEPATPGQELDSTIQNQPCGERPSDASALEDPGLSLWNSLKGLSTEDYEQFVEHYEWQAIRAGISSSYRLRKLEQCTSETDYLSCPTLTSCSSKSSRPAGMTKCEKWWRDSGLIPNGSQLSAGAIARFMGYPEDWFQVLSPCQPTLQAESAPDTSLVEPSHQLRLPWHYAESSTSIPSVNNYSPGVIEDDFPLELNPKSVLGDKQTDRTRPLELKEHCDQLLLVLGDSNVEHSTYPLEPEQHQPVLEEMLAEEISSSLNPLVLPSVPFSQRKLLPPVRGI